VFGTKLLDRPTQFVICLVHIVIHDGLIKELFILAFDASAFIVRVAEIILLHKQTTMVHSIKTVITRDYKLEIGFFIKFILRIGNLIKIFYIKRSIVNKIHCHSASIISHTQYILLSSCQ